MKSLKSKIEHLSDNQERINALKDIAKGETAYLITCGPTLTTHDREELIEKLDGKLVLACKQAYDYVKEVATFHLLSVYNYQDYTYHSADTIRHWQLTAMNIQGELDRINSWNQRIDMMVPVYSTPWIQKWQTTAYTRDFNNWFQYQQGKAVWGPGIMYESGFPLALHMGVKDIVTIGWDIGDLSKYDSTDKMAFDSNWTGQHATALYKTETGMGPEYEELKNTIDCTKEMYDFFLTNEVKVRILSNTSPADERFERITLQDL